jgi:Na+/H+-dicarboxylate symporter
MLKFINKFKILLSIMAIILFSVVFSEQIPTHLKVVSFTISNTIRQLLLYILPGLIFPFMVTSIASMKTRGAYLIGSIMVMVTVSNFISIMIPYFVGQIGIPYLNMHGIEKIATAQELQPYWDLGLEPFMKMEYTMMLALVVGLYIGLSGTHIFDNFFKRYLNFSRGFFERVFIPILPIYVLGTILKISHETDFKSLLPVFGGMILMIICTQLTYITFLYYIGSGRDIKRTLFSIKNAFQSCIVGFSTMSSVVTMPITLAAAEKNIPEDPASARITVSTTVNCHDVGECISLPIQCLRSWWLSHNLVVYPCQVAAL